MLLIRNERMKMILKIYFLSPHISALSSLAQAEVAEPEAKMVPTKVPRQIFPARVYNPKRKSRVVCLECLGVAESWSFRSVCTRHLRVIKIHCFNTPAVRLANQYSSSILFTSLPSSFQSARPTLVDSCCFSRGCHCLSL